MGTGSESKVDRAWVISGFVSDLKENGLSPDYLPTGKVVPSVAAYPQFQTDAILLSVVSFVSSGDCVDRAKEAIAKIEAMKANCVDDWTICDCLKNTESENVVS